MPLHDIYRAEPSSMARQTHSMATQAPTDRLCVAEPSGMARAQHGFYMAEPSGLASIQHDLRIVEPLDLVKWKTSAHSLGPSDGCCSSS
jgi:hypothetical protein